MLHTVNKTGEIRTNKKTTNKKKHIILRTIFATTQTLSTQKISFDIKSVFHQKKRNYKNASTKSM